ncbi:hypothetical protein ACQKRQ_38370 [Paraburkholderia sp. NPDC080076]|uniref:hypothetical protein n=1 Tax=Paraburkholderia sp. NPDC080076 TaxID=3390605 RepID=UPI003D0562E7
MANGPRNLVEDAFYADEWPLAPVLTANPRGVQFSRFTAVIPGFPPAIEPMSKFTQMPNPLNPTVTAGLAQPEVIPAEFQNDLEAFCIFVPPLLAATLIVNPQAVAKVTLLFCVGTEFNRHGLRTFFVPKADRVLITISGREAGSVKAWGVGISDQQIRQLFVEAGFPSATIVADTFAGYSTGYRGVNGTINNRLVGLDQLKRIVFLDALYRGDDPPPGGNTSRMIRAARAVNPNADLVVYEVTDGGTPRDAAGSTAVLLPPTARSINLKPRLDALKGFILARVSENGVNDGYLVPNSIPAAIRQLSVDLPPRGTLASSPLTEARASNGTLAAWAAGRHASIAAGVAQSRPLMELIQQNILTGWAFPDLGSMCHDGFMPEFGWEFLAG